MCAVAGGAYGASQSKLPVSTPVTAALEQAGGGRSIKDNFKQNTGLGKVAYPAVQPQYSNKSRKIAVALKSNDRTGNGLRINNPHLNTGLQGTAL